jgi:transcriptional regulator with XRE-family HTH domain
MTSAELKTMREAIGLSVPELAAFANNVQERTVRYWESGRNQVPEDVERLVMNISQLLDLRAIELAESIRELIKLDGPLEGPFVLIRYKENADLWHFEPQWKSLPTTAYGAFLTRCRVALADLDVATRIVYMDPQAYSEWLDGRQDELALRMSWAILQ